MKRYALSLALLLAAASAALALEVPKLTRRVTDLAGAMSSSQAEEIEQRLKAFEDSTSTQIVVLLIPTLEGESIEDFSIRVAEENKIGQKGKDNGILFLAAIQDRKMRFDVGYGLEGSLTDALTTVIREEIIKPRFREGDYYRGVLDGMDAAMKATRGEFKAEPKKKGSDAPIGVIVFFLIFFFVIINGIRKRRGGGGGSIFFTGGSGWHSHSGGSSWGGSSWGGGGSSFGGGGWSGGGGSFGGGGSSGDW